MVDETDSSPTRMLLDRFRNAARDAEISLDNEEYQQAMAFYFDASQAADEMTERFLTLVMKTAPSNSHRTMIIEVMSWRLRYFTAQYDYHLAVAQTLSGLPREEWIARLETILVLSKSLVDKFLPILRDSDEINIRVRIHALLNDWVQGIRNLVAKLQGWGMASAQAAQILEWALDNEIETKRE
ncbi:MAG: hypothetical protein ACTSUO_05690 [Candidatus Thorarchaeota archaeon]